MKTRRCVLGDANVNRAEAATTEADAPFQALITEAAWGHVWSRDTITYLGALDPNFGGCGRTPTDDQGYYIFRTVKPGAYPWGNWVNSWRPAHAHVSVFGTSFSQRLITQMYFEGDPLIAQCPIVATIPDPRAIDQLIAPLDMNAAVPLDCLAYTFDIFLRGRRSTLFENRLEEN